MPQHCCGDERSALHELLNAPRFLFRFVAQASCLWGNRASRLMEGRIGRQDARRSHRQEGCATQSAGESM